MTDIQDEILSDDKWNPGLTEEEIRIGFEELKNTGVYERDVFGDLMLPGIANGVHKKILIFNTNLESPHDPISVIDPLNFGGYIDSNTPVILAYDLSHFESLHPCNEADVQKSIELVECYQNGDYGYKRSDIPMLVVGTCVGQNINEFSFLSKNVKHTILINNDGFILSKEIPEDLSISKK